LLYGRLPVHLELKDIAMIEKNWLDLKKPDEMEIKVSEYNPSQAVVAVGPV
jgi:hypothetical protein